MIFSWKREKLELAPIMFAMDQIFLGFLQEKLSPKKEDDVQVRVVKCHPSDRPAINCDDPILSLDYFDVIEDA